MTVRPKEKEMWAILHVPSGIWDHGHSNETLYWAEYEAALECQKRNGSFDETWKPVAVKVVVL